MSRSIDEVFPDQSVLDEVPDIVIELLEAEPRLLQWTEGRIRRLPGAFSPQKGLLTPCILLAMVDTDATFKPSGGRERNVFTVGIIVVFPERLETVPKGSRTIVTVQDWIKKALLADPLLTDAAGNHRAERLHKFNLSTFDGTPAGGDKVTLWYGFEAVYWVDLNAITRDHFAAP
jgi:hypothetical protein